MDLNYFLEKSSKRIVRKDPIIPTFKTTISNIAVLLNLTLLLHGTFCGQIEN